MPDGSLPGARARRRWMVAALSAVVALPVLAFAIVVVVLFTRQQRQSVEIQLGQLARTVVQAGDLLLASRRATFEGLEALAAAADIDAFTVQARRLLDRRGDWLLIALDDPAPGGGRLVLETGPDLPAPAEAGPAAAAPTADAPAADAPIVDLPTVLLPDAPLDPGAIEIDTVLLDDGEPPRLAVRLRGAVTGAGGRPLVATALLDPAPFSTTLAGPVVPEGWVAALLDPSLRIVGRSRAPEDFVGTPATPSLARAIGMAPEHRFYSIDKEGNRLFTAISTSPRTGWIAAVGAPAQTAEAPLRRARLAMIGGGAGSVLLALLLAGLLARNAARRTETERRLLAVEADRRTERRLADIAANFPGIIYRRVRDAGGRISYPYVSSGAAALLGPGMVGAPDAERSTALVREALVPEDQDRWAEALQRSAASMSPYDLEGRVRSPDGEVRWVRSIAHTHPGPDGSVVWDGVVLDITPLKQAEAHQALLLAELNHRVKNTLAVVLAIAQQTLRHSPSLEAFAPAFQGRLQALARTHTLLTEHSWTTTALRALVEQALAPYAAGGAARIDGPPVILRPKPALAFSLVLHELATNASKYGALSAADGVVEVTWAPVEPAAGGSAAPDRPAGTAKDRGPEDGEAGEDGPAIRLVWRERNGPPLPEGPPSRRGFGSQLIEVNVENELGGRVRIDRPPDGLVCEIVVPWDPDSGEIRP